jgi:hypothetical protein
MYGSARIPSFCLASTIARPTNILAFLFQRQDFRCPSCSVADVSRYEHASPSRSPAEMKTSLILIDATPFTLSFILSAIYKPHSLDMSREKAAIMNGTSSSHRYIIASPADISVRVSAMAKMSRTSNTAPLEQPTYHCCATSFEDESARVHRFRRMLIQSIR